MREGGFERHAIVQVLQQRGDGQAAGLVEQRRGVGGQRRPPPQARGAAT